MPWIHSMYTSSMSLWLGKFLPIFLRVHNRENREFTYVGVQVLSRPKYLSSLFYDKLSPVGIKQIIENTP